MSPLKVIVSGPVGAGKTTLIQTLSEIPVVETEELASEQIGKQTTTVGLDFGLLRLDGVPIHLFGTPGQERFSFVWDVLLEGALGLVLLISGARPQDFPRARKILEYLTSRHPVPFVVGVTHQDIPKVWQPEEVAHYFQLPQEQVIGMNAKSRSSALQSLVRILELIEGKTQDAR
jgi:small GTP-binding protein